MDSLSPSRRAPKEENTSKTDWSSLKAELEYLIKNENKLYPIMDESVCLCKNVQEAKQGGDQFLTVHAFHTNGKEQKGEGEEKGAITDLLKRIAYLEIDDKPAVEQKVFP